MMSEPREAWAKGRFVFWSDGDMECELDDGHICVDLEPAEAINLASALLQYATQNGVVE